MHQRRLAFRIATSIATVIGVLISALPTGTHAAEASQAGGSKEMTTALKRYNSLLSDIDANVRAGALDEMLKSSEPLIRERGYAFAFASPESSLRATALRARLKNASMLVVEKFPETDFDLAKDDAATGFFDKSFTIGHFVLKDDGNIACYGCNGRLAGLELNLSFANKCSLRLRLVDGARMLGKLSCPKPDESSGVRLRLQ